MKSKVLTVGLLVGALCLAGLSSTLAYDEAPMLRVKVAAGELPPVEERLPKVPARCVDVDLQDIDLEIGQYGGLLRTIHTGKEYTIGGIGAMFERDSWLSIPGGLAGVEGLKTLTPNLLQGYEVSEDAKVFTFYLREGLRWSDGHPFTTEDVLFWWEDVLHNEQLSPSLSPVWKAVEEGGKGGKLKVIDEYTFQISFDVTFTSWPLNMSREGYDGSIVKPFAFYPKHWDKQWHVRYTPLQDLEAQIEEGKFEKGEWWKLFQLKTTSLIEQLEGGRPTLAPWVVTKVTATEAFAERNPYYWKVDSAGNQLPYIDRVKYTKCSNSEVATMKTLAGEVDLQYYHTKAAEIPLYRRFAEEYGFRVVLLGWMEGMAEIFLNLSYDDSLWREVVHDVRFRKALNYAIDRQGINDAVFYGLGNLPHTIVFNNNEYNPDKANLLLDEMGLDQRDNDNWRLGPDGKPFTIRFDYTDLWTEMPKSIEMVMRQWREVGVKTTMKLIPFGEWLSVTASGEFQATSWALHYMKWPYASTIVGERLWAPRWFNYRFRGQEEYAEELPAEVEKLYGLFEELGQITTVAEVDAMWEEIRQLISDNAFWFSVLEGGIAPMIVSVNLGNVPHSGYVGSAIQSTEQMFFKE